MSETNTNTPATLPALVDSLTAAQMIFSCSLSLFKKLRRDCPDFPKPVKLGERAIRFRTSELLAWAQRQGAVQ